MLREERRFRSRSRMNAAYEAFLRENYVDQTQLYDKRDDDDDDDDVDSLTINFDNEQCN